MLSSHQDERDWAERQRSFTVTDVGHDEAHIFLAQWVRPAARGSKFQLHGASLSEPTRGS
jgi:hypothetical protein